MQYQCKIVTVALLVAVMALSIFHHKSNLSTVELEQLYSKNHQHSNHVNGYTNSTQQSQSSQKIFSDGEAQYHRQLWGMHMSKFLDAKTVDVHGEGSSIPPLPPYDFRHNIAVTPQTFRRELFILYYDPTADEFQVYIDETKDKYYAPVYSPTHGRLKIIMPILTYALRNHFPDRFKGKAGGSSEFIVLFSTGDCPELDCGCVQKNKRLKHASHCQNDKFAPILHFGSVFKDTEILPSMVTMPIWVHLEPCFLEWQRQGTVCEELRMRHDVAGVLVGGEDPPVGKQMPFSTWDSLVPTMIWRGTEFAFLYCLHPGLIHEMEWDRDVAPRVARFGNHARGVMQSLLDMWDSLTPRMKTVSLSAMARLDAKEANWATTPWIDARYTVKENEYGAAVNSVVQQRYLPFQEYGIAMTSPKMSLAQLSKFKYHLDLGGGGGTTWFGTIEKLAMPGVLFHHVTSSKDYFHDDLVPWKHFIPVNEDLSNLRVMFDWAESNSEEARKISEAGTEYVKSRAKPEVMKATYERYFVHSLKAVIDAYQPLEGHPAKNSLNKWLSKWSQVGRCSGKVKEDCKFKNWKVPQ